MLIKNSTSIIPEFLRKNNTTSVGGSEKKWFHAEIVLQNLAISLYWLDRDDVADKFGGRANLPSLG
jgi:hypothetical protein